MTAGRLWSVAAGSDNGNVIKYVRIGGWGVFQGWPGRCSKDSRAEEHFRLWARTRRHSRGTRPGKRLFLGEINPLLAFMQRNESKSSRLNSVHTSSRFSSTCHYCLLDLLYTVLSNSLHFMGFFLINGTPFLNLISIHCICRICLNKIKVILLTLFLVRKFEKTK